MTVVLVPVSTHQSRRRIERDLVKLESDASTKEDKGRRVDARHRQPDALVGLDERWLQLARWEPKAVDAIIKFGKSAQREWQTTVALTWIEAVIDDRFDLIATSLYLLEEGMTIGREQV